MLLFAHTGITLGVGVFLEQLSSKYSSRMVSHIQKTNAASPESESTVSNKTLDPFSLSRHPDLRFLVIGSILPDLIDKPIGHFFFRDVFNNGRIFSHSLLFLIIIGALGFYLFKHGKKTWLLVLSSGVLMHLLLDEMWLNTHTLFWPLYGFLFEKGDTTDWLPGMFHSLQTNPSVYIPELIGLVILIWFLIHLIRRRRIINFLKSGQYQ